MSNVHQAWMTCLVAMQGKHSGNPLEHKVASRHSNILPGFLLPSFMAGICQIPPTSSSFSVFPGEKKALPVSSSCAGISRVLLASWLGSGGPLHYNIHYIM
jgi:hypothetical protein